MSVATPSAPRPGPHIQTRPTPAATSSSSTSRALVSKASRPAPKPSPTVTSSTSVTSSTIAGPSASAFLVPGKDTSSSAGKVFAKPSREWVLPERAKPGRKVSVEEPDSKRQSQNRQSQRAHRARRTDYISTLEERIRQFENDEISSNVRLQEVARALKADNERLKSEILSLRTRQASEGVPKGWEEERALLLSEVRGLREELRQLRSIPGIDRSGSIAVTPRPTSSDGLRHCPICPNPDPDCPCQKSTTQHPIHLTRTHLPDPSIPLGSTVGLLLSPPPTRISCGFCESTDECLCRMVEEEDVKPIIISPPNPSMSLDDGCGLCADGGFCACAVALNSPNKQAMAYMPDTAAAVPLRKRSTGAVPNRKPVWALESGVVPVGETLVQGKEAVCSGDPRNCDACRNDTFGQEFCSNFFKPNDPSHSCTNCRGTCSSTTAGPSRPTAPSPDHLEASPYAAEPQSGPLIMACCGSPALCGQHSSCAGEVIGIGGLIPGLPEEQVEHETIRVDQAWKQLKAHPNVKFASLAFLADVVAQRTRPTNTSEVGSPLPIPRTEFPAVERGLGEKDDPKGKRKAVVETSAVRDALRLLDTTPAPGDEDEARRRSKRSRVD